MNIPYDFTGNDIASVAKLLSSPKKIIITTHFKPDGDAMGSSLGLYHFLLQSQHTVTVVTPSDYPDFLFWMPGNDKVVNFQLNNALAEQLFLEADLVFCLDFNTPERVEGLKPFLLETKAIKILIDHHPDPAKFCDYQFSFPQSAATGELVFYLFHALKQQNLINQPIAECLYTGIMTDTGSFRFPSMTGSLHRVIADLMDAGARKSMIHEKIYDDFTESRTRLLGYCLNDKLVILSQFQVAYIALSEKELNKFHYKTGDTEGIVNYGLGIKGIKMAVLFTEKQGLIKISFRSRDQVAVNRLAEQHFSGGGHKNAAGGKSLLSLTETVDKFIALLPGLKLV